MVGVTVGRVEEPGRYRRDKRTRSGPVKSRPVKRVLSFSVVLAVPAAIALFPVPVADRSPSEASIAAADDRNLPSGRSDIREPGEPAPAPTHVATIVERVVNGRLQPTPVEPPSSAEGDYAVADGTSEPPERPGDVVRYIVEVEKGLPFDPDEFATAVHTILNDERGWGPEDDIRFKRVDDEPARFRVSLSSPDLTDAECYPLRTRGEVSCWNGSRSVINAKRWGIGADTFDGDILTYREYLINHEVGHALGRGHESCPEQGAPAPVMVQQTKSLEGCEANPWPSH